MRPGEIYRHEAFYIDTETGEWRAKFLIILAHPDSGDVVARLLTSRHAGLRQEQPPCHHGDPYPSFFLGVLGGALGAKSWIDLRGLDDVDAEWLGNELRHDRLRFVTALNPPTLRHALSCAAGAPDTTRRQERRIRDALSALTE